MSLELLDCRVSYRNKCRVCGCEKLSLILKLPTLPITGAFLESLEEDQEFLHDVDLYFCNNCSLVQTQHDVDLTKYYEKYSYTADISSFAQKFMDSLAKTVWNKWSMKKGDVVLEIGSGDGAQLKYFQKLGAKVLGYEPSVELSNISRMNGVPCITDLFHEQSTHMIPDVLKPAQLVLFFHVLDHIPDPLDVLKSIRKVIDSQRGLLVIEVHDFEQTFLSKEYCLFQHEHTMYPSAATLQTMVALAGFDVVEVGLLPENQKRAHSLLVVATPRGSIFSDQAIPSIPLGLHGSHEGCCEFGEDVKKTLQNIKEFFKYKKQQNIRIAGYGAGGRGIMTLASTVEIGDLSFISDKSPVHHGSYLPSSHIKVLGLDQISKDKVDELLVFSYGYLSEIKKDLSEFIENGGRIISLLDILNESTNR